MPIKVAAIDKESPLYGYVRPGYELVAVNGEKVHDNLDCMFKLAEETAELIFRTPDGEKKSFFVEYPDDLGIEFTPDKIKICKNKCIFCFVHQQPRGMRKSLYLKDEDFRLSFTHGNFISLSNITEEDIARIIEQKLSPLYVSVHTTDDSLRRELFRNKRLKPILPQLKHLANNGITIHTQAVIVPGINDNIHLDKTINDLYNLYPGVNTLGVVPVGLTRYRKNLPKLKSFDKAGAEGLLNRIATYQRSYLKKSGSRFVFAADEFYILAGHDFPRLSEYEEMEQFENGIGMMRLLLTDFNRRKRYLRSLNSKKRFAAITGLGAYPVLTKKIKKVLHQMGIRLDFIPIENKFWGKQVNVSGLLTGQDIMHGIENLKQNYDTIILPPNCLNNDDLFLDDISLEDLRGATKSKLSVGSYSIIDTIKEAIA